MEIKQFREIIIAKDITLGFVCDVCKKENVSEFIPDDWICFFSKHEAWGNDSVESLEYHHVCSSSCYTSKVNDLVEKLKDYKEYNIEIAGLTWLAAKNLCDYIDSLQV